MAPAHAQQQVVACKFAGRQVGAAQPGQAGIFLGRGFGVQLQDAAFFGNGGCDHRARGGGAEMGERDLADGQVGLDQQEDRDARPHGALRKQRGAAEIQTVASRPPQHRDRGQGRVQRGDQRVLLAGQAIGQQ